MIRPILPDLTPIPPGNVFVLPIPAGKRIFTKVAYPVPALGGVMLIVGFECATCGRVLHADTTEDLRHECGGGSRWVMARGNA